MKDEPHFRWRATIFYRSELGSLDIDHLLEELEDVHDVVESGPHWDTIEKIEITRVNHCDSSTLTVEKSETI